MQGELFTPQRGILRRSNSVAQKRTVMFAASQQSNDSSSSDLIFYPPVSESASKRLCLGVSCGIYVQSHGCLSSTLQKWGRMRLKIHILQTDLERHYVS